jgi:hypothetical protein
MKPVIGSEELRTAGNDQSAPLDATEAAFRSVLDDYRDEIRSAVQHPNSFWSAQHAAIMDRIRSQQSLWRISLSWVVATALVFFGFGLFLFRVPAQPIPDYAGGYDQDLLIDVEQALHRDLPSALEPVLILSDELEHNLNNTPMP